MLDNLQKIRSLLTNRQIKALLILVILLSLGMIMEVLSLSLIIPLVSSITEPDYFINNFFYKKFNSLIYEISPSNFFKLFLVATFFIYLIKTVFLIVLSYIQFKFIANLSAYLQTKFYNNFLSQQYDFYIQKNSNSLIKNIQIEIPILIRYVLSLVTFFVESGLIISVILTLIFIAPIPAFSVGIFLFLASMIFFRFSKNKLKKWGMEREKLDQDLTKVLLEGIGGIKEYKVLKRESYFINLYSRFSYEISKRHASHNLFSSLPRFYLEIITILGIVGFILILLIQEINASEMFAVLGTFVAASFRLIPSVNKVISSLQNMKYQSIPISKLAEEFSILEKGLISHESRTMISFKKTISLEHLYFKHKGATTYLFEDLNLKINKGEMIGFVGESGSGKSTLIDLILGLLKPEKGKILIDEKTYLNKEQSKGLKNVGYVPQQIYLLDDSIKNNISLGIPNENINKGQLNKAIDAAQLNEFIKQLPKGLNTVVGERGVQISGGQMQRIGIARALYNNPEILILDEATSALDNNTEIEFIKSIDLLKSKKTIIMIAHRISSLVNCDRVYNLQSGKLNEISAKSLMK